MENKPKYKDEIDFKEILKNPVRLYGWFFILFLVVTVAGGVFYVKHMDNVSFNAVPVGLENPKKIIPAVPKKKGGIQLAADLNLIKNPSPELIEKGKELFNTTCASCHGESGEGNGPAGLNLNPKPRNFHSADGWTNGRKFSEIFKTLTEGILQNGMAAYEYIPANDRFALIHYIRTFTNDYPEITDEEVNSMEIEYGLLEGKKQPNTIPVDLAEKKIAEEHQNIIEKVNKVLMSLEMNKAGAAMLRDYTTDVRKAVYSVINYGLDKDFNKFREVLLNENIDLGFKSSILTLSDTQWKRLFQQFNSI